MSMSLPVQNIFIDNQALLTVINSAHSPFDWCLAPSLDNLRQLLVTAGNPMIHVIPHSWITPATKLAVHGANLHSLSLFLLGQKLPWWIMKYLLDFGFSFWCCSFSFFLLVLAFFWCFLPSWLGTFPLLLINPLGFLKKKKDSLFPMLIHVG